MNYSTKLLFVLIAIITFKIQAQIVSIPDAIFKARLLAHDPVVDTNNDGEIQVSEALNMTTTLHLTGSFSNDENIVDLTGIEAFINISTINAGRNELTAIDVTQNFELRNLRLDDNFLTEIDVSQNVLLQGLVLYNNNAITNIDVSHNPELRNLQASDMDLGTLDLSQNPQLTGFVCTTCNLSTINLTNNVNLNNLLFGGNPIQNIDLSQNILLRDLSLSGTEISSLDLTNLPLIRDLDLASTKIISLILSENTMLTSIDLRNNLFLEQINLKNGANDILDITSTFPSNFTNLPVLERVCLDDIDSNLATFILDQVGHPITFTEDCSILAVAENTTLDVTLYPNPATNFISLTTNQQIKSILVFDITGKKIEQKPMLQNNTLDISILPSGLYLINIKTDAGKQVTKKIIKL